MFWRSLHRQAVPVAPLLNLLNRDYFAMDRKSIGLAGRAKTMRQLNEGIRDYLMDYRNQQGLRNNAGLRLSTSRLRKLAGPYLPAMAAEPPKAPPPR